MIKANNIAKTLGLMAVILLLALPRYAFAQPDNSARRPFIDSEHAYRVPIGAEANDREWILTDGTPGNTYNLTDDDALISWAEVVPIGAGAGQAGDGYYGVSITFVRSIFDLGALTSKDWTLEYYEFDAVRTCVSARKYTITVYENQFRLAVGADVATQCNSQSGISHKYNTVDDETYDTQVTYTVIMRKNEEFDPTSWQFDAEFDQDITGNAFIATSATDGVLSTTELTANRKYRISVTHPSGSNPSEVTVTLTVSFANTVLVDVPRTIKVTNGKAIVSTTGAPDAITDDNYTTYPEVPATPGIRNQAITILGLPNTTDITAADALGSTPMLLSTHEYDVTVERFVGSTLSWVIKNAAGTVTLVEGDDYDLTQSNVGNAVTASINFMDKTVPQGAYVIYFTELYNTSGCSSVRPFNITLKPPFDADLVAINDDCSGADGQIYDVLAARNTTVTYTVKLESEAYEDTWSFNFVLACAEFGKIDNTKLEATSITVDDGTNPLHIINNADKITVTKNGVTPVEREVTITVVYSGEYAVAHTVTATLNNAKGNFNETDADDGIVLEDVGAVEGEINQARHVIHAMPQAGTLAGVD